MASNTFGIAQFFERFPDEEACLQHVFETKWGTHSACPSCGQLGAWSRIKGTKKWRHSCRKHLSPLKNTVMYRSNLPLMAWFYTFWLFSNASMGVRASFVRKQLGIGHNSSYRLCRMVRVHMATMVRPLMIGGDGKTVHIDEVHLRYITSAAEGCRDSVIVLGMACDGQVMSAIVPDRKSETLIPHIAARVRPGSKIVTDMLSSYAKLEKHGFEHIRINHSVAFHDFHGHSNNEIEAYWATVRRMMRASRQVSREHLWAFLAEIEFKYNRRHSKHAVFEELISSFPSNNFDNTQILQRQFDWSWTPAYAAQSNEPATGMDSAADYKEQPD